jgi:serine/threonine protein kinase/WD40 repeat protein
MTSRSAKYSSRLTLFGARMHDSPLPSVKHPNDETLHAFLEGKVSTDLTSRIRVHLKSCTTCRNRIDEIHAEDLLSRESVQMAGNDQPVNANLPSNHEVNSNLSSHSQRPVSASKKKVPPNRPSEPASDAKLLASFLADHPTYRLIKEIARGGVGVLYLVEHRITGRHEALKVMNPNLAERPDVQERFIREIQACAKLDHRNIVRTHSAFREARLLGMVMEYAPGMNLKDVVNKVGAIDSLEAIDYVTQAAEGLQHAFEKNLIHRDIKPSNLMLTRDGKEDRIKILDFGLVRSTSDISNASDMTVDGRILGTVEFMAPEQALNASQADIRSDIYSLGCTLFFLLTGKPPFSTGNALATLNAHQNQPIPKLSAQLPAIRPEVQVVLEKMMAKQPEHRFQSPRQLVHALDALRSSLLNVSPTPQAVSKSTPTKRVANPATQSVLNSLSPSQSKSKPKHKSLQSRLLSSLTIVLPTIALGGLVYFVPKEKWQAILQGQLPQTSSIAIDKIPSGVEVLIDDFPAKLMRPQAEGAPEIEAKPGKYRVSFTRSGKEIAAKEVVVPAGTRVVLDVDFPDEKLSLPSNASDKAAFPKAALTTQPHTTEIPTNVNAAQDAVSKETQEKLNRIKTALANHDVEGVLSLIAQLPSKTADTELTQELARVRILGRMLSLYRETMRNRLKSFSSGESFEIVLPKNAQSGTHEVNSETVSVVEASADAITLRIRGRNGRFKTNSMPVSVLTAIMNLASGTFEFPPESLSDLGIIVSDQSSVQEKRLASESLEQSFRNGHLPASIRSFIEPAVFTNPVPAILDVRQTPAPIKSEIIPIEGEPPTWIFARELLGHSGPVLSAQFLADGRLTSCQEMSFNNAVLDPNRYKNHLIHWVLKTGEAMPREVKLDRLIDFDVSPNGRMLSYLGSSNQVSGELSVWIEKSKTAFLTFKDLSNLFASVHFSSDSRSLALVDGNGSCLRWSLSSSSNARQPQKSNCTHPIGGHDLVTTALSRKLDLVAQSSNTGTVIVWKVDDGQRLFSSEDLDPTQRKIEVANGLAFLNEDKSLLTFRSDGSVERFNIANKVIDQTVRIAKSIEKVAFSKNRQLALVTDLDREWSLVSLDPLKCLSRWREIDSNPISTLAISDDGATVAIGFSSGKIRVWSKTPPAKK